MYSAKSPFELAALATAAVPGMRVTEVREPQYDNESRSVTGIVDSEGNSWLVVSAHQEITREDVEKQIRLLRYLDQCSTNRVLTFSVPQVQGLVSTGTNTYAQVFSDPGGKPLEERDLGSDGLLAASLARSLASLHNLGIQEAAQLGVSYFSVDDIRNEIRQLLSAVRHSLPSRLLKRWGVAIDEDLLWSFTTAPVHADLSPSSIFAEQGAILSVDGLENLRIGDPAIDVAWILPLADDGFLSRFQETYCGIRSQVDLHILTRAQLYSELALARWVAYGLETQNKEIILEGQTMLAELDEDLDGEMLIQTSRPVAEIRFSPADEPLNRLKDEVTLDSSADIHIQENEEISIDSNPIEHSESVFSSTDSAPVIEKNFSGDGFSPNFDDYESISDLSFEAERQDDIATSVFLSQDLSLQSQPYPGDTDPISLDKPAIGDKWTNEAETSDLDDILLETEDLSDLLEQILNKDERMSEDTGNED